jgi:ABC-type amino acid transport substrate-binding protein
MTAFRPTTLATASLFLGALSAAGAADLDAIKQRGTLRVIVAADEAPETFALRAGGEPGFERELVDGFARLQGVSVEVVVAKGYAERIPMLQRGQGDLIVAIFDTPDRRALVDFTLEVMPTHNVAVTLAPRAPVTSVDELKGLRVGVVKGTKPADTALEVGVPRTALQEVATRDDLVAALVRQQMDAAILPVSELVLASRRAPKLQAGARVGASGTVAWAVRRSDRDLRDALDLYLGNVRRSPSWNRLIVKYFGDQALSVLGRARDAP